MNFSWRDLRTLLGGLLCLFGLVSSTYAGMAEIRVRAGTDDGEQHLDDDRMDLTSSDLELGEEGAGDFQEVGIRFADIPVGQGINIDTAFIQFAVDNDDLDSVATSLRIFGELTPNSALFGSAAGNITDRTRTTSFIDWNDIPAWDTAGEAGADQRTPSLTPILEEIFNQPTWATGNSLSFIVVANPGGERSAESFDGDSDLAPLLVFTGADVPDIVLPPPPPPPTEIFPPLGGEGNIYLPDGGRFVVEAESYSSRSIGETNAHEWLEIDGETGLLVEGPDTGTAPIGPSSPSNTRANFMRQLPDVLAGTAGNTDDSLTLGPNLDFTLRIAEPGEYQLYVRFDGHDGNSDSMFATVVETQDGVGGDAADWYRFAHGSHDFDFGPDPWLGDGEFEGNSAGGNNVAAVWDIASTGDYTVRAMIREDGAALDSIVFQLSDLPPPTGFGPALTGFIPPQPFIIDGGGETYLQDFDGMGSGRRIPRGWSGATENGIASSAAGLGLTDGFLTVPGNAADGVLGILNLGGNADSFGPATAGHIPTWTAELAGANDLFGQDDAVADNATDRALGVSRVDNDEVGELNFEIEIAGAAMRAFVLDWDLEIWGGDPDGAFRSPEGPGMKVDVRVGDTPYHSMAENLLPGDLFDSLEDGGDTDHNATLIDGNVHSVRGMSSGIKEVSGNDGAVGNLVQINFNTNWNDSTTGPDGWISAIDNVRLRALAPGDADANGVVDVTDLLALLGGQKFNAGVDGVTWAQGDFNADDQFDTSDLLAMLSFLSGTFPSDPYASEAGGASDAVADIIVNSETGEVTVDLAGHTVSAVIIESASEIFNGQQPEWDTTSQFPSTLPGELGNVLFTSTAAGTDELGAVISAEFLGRDKEFYLQDLDLNILIASEGGALTKGNVIVVPEPSTWLMLGLGSLALVGVIRRRTT